MTKQKIKIKADPQLASLLPKYLENRKRDLLAFKNFIQQDDFEAIRKLSHSIKGHAASYGFKELTEICAKIERAAEQKNTTVIMQLLTEYENYINNVEL
ncbi:MAG: Hpt domain-containing protein [Oligoflexia bacterium]|nr:Hpt domain-containing protein [Oligoflexia bacterium]